MRYPSNEICSRDRFSQRRFAPCIPCLLSPPLSGRRVATCRFFDQVDARYRIPAHRTYPVKRYLCVSDSCMSTHASRRIFVGRSMCYLRSSRKRRFIQDKRFIYVNMSLPELSANSESSPRTSSFKSVKMALRTFGCHLSSLTQVWEGRAVGSSSGPAERNEKVWPLRYGVGLCRHRSSVRESGQVGGGD